MPGREDFLGVRSMPRSEAAVLPDAGRTMCMRSYAVGARQGMGEDLYADNDFDRGRLVRRLHPAWERVQIARSANDGTFHFTNCFSPT
jgi:hypothetical protein